jgi:hypothetical protein
VVEIYRISDFFCVYPISALFATTPESQRINLCKFHTRFVLQYIYYFFKILSLRQRVDTRETIPFKAFSKNILPQITIPPPYFSFEKRYKNIIHTKLRHNCILLCDLHKRNITNFPYSSCGHIEDTYHFFFACKNYSRAFNRLLVLTWSILTEICFYLVIMLYLYKLI